MENEYREWIMALPKQTITRFNNKIAELELLEKKADRSLGSYVAKQNRGNRLLLCHEFLIREAGAFILDVIQADIDGVSLSCAFGRLSFMVFDKNSNYLYPTTPGDYDLILSEIDTYSESYYISTLRKRIYKLLEYRAVLNHYSKCPKKSLTQPIS